MSPGVTIRVRLWAQLRDAASCGEWELELPAGSTVATGLESVYARFPKIREWDRSLLLAVGTEYALRTQVLCEGDELSLMPPVQGG
ncbi:MAG: MoaD/ThiS family protein [Verrucomicrobiae bacterium]|nr:MoaD/ThiS family protein [Verrucomicrobiae bacterium]